MTTRLRLWLVTGLTFLFFLLVLWVTEALLEPDPSGVWLLRGGLLALGGTATAVVFRYLSQRWKDDIRREKLAAREDEIASAFRSARKRLDEAGRGSPGKLPVVLVLGPRGATKTTSVVESGLDPELLAGEVHQGDTVVPTEGVNVWYASGSLFVEAEGGMMKERNRWEALVDHLRPDRLAAALGRGRLAPRVAVVCVPCDDLQKPGASESVPALARTLRERLVEAADALGVRLPVYVLFTRADRLPHFEDFVRSLTSQEVREGVGATLPLSGSRGPGTYGEDASRRIGGALDGIIHSLALRRLDILRRESEEEVRAGVYEFPRELRKASPLVRDFLVELGRPTQLGVSPVVRGFYFTGVRAVTVQDSGSPAPSRPSPSSSTPMGATAVFDAAEIQARAQAARQDPRAGRSRRVPEWAFLEPVMQRVVMGDESARALTTGGARVDVLRRSLLTAAALVGLFLSGAFVLSYLNNRALTRDVLEAARPAAEVGRDGGTIPSLEELERLEALRVQAQRLRDWEEEGPPLSRRWGLYTGDDLLPEVREIYLQGYERVMGRATRQALLNRMGSLPDEPTEASEYGDTYDVLKAYLITTSHPEESSADFLPPVLLATWPTARTLEPERLDLTRSQMQLYADWIAEGYPGAPQPDDASVRRTRDFLAQFAGADRFYQTLLASVQDSVAAVDFGERFPGSQGVVVNEYTVPAAFTRPAWAQIRQQLRNVDSFFTAEDWVVGGQGVSPEDREALARQLRQRYEAEYVDRWRSFLEAGRVVGFGSAAGAASVLGRLSDSQSPLLQMFALTSRNTALDSSVTAAFQPVHSVQPPDVEDRYVGEWNQPWVGAVGDLQAAMDQVASSPGGGQSGAIRQASQAASRAEGAVRTLAQSFSIREEAQPAAAAVRSLLESPIRRAEGLLGGIPRGELNAAGRSFCSSFGGYLDGYPFRAGASRAVSMDDVSAALKPGESALWTFYQDHLEDRMVRQGNRYEARPGTEPALSRGFVEFFNAAAGASEALFDESGEGPQTVFVLRPQTSDQLPEVTVSIDGQTQTFTRTQAAARTFLWEGDRARDAEVTGVIGGEPQVLLEVPPGPWALFRLFQLADWEPLGAGSGRYTVRWDLPGQAATLTAELNLASRVPIFDRDFLDRIRCTPQVAR
jgi:type VI secretion system protein ImpL